MAVAFAVSVGAEDWSSDISGWRCAVLAVPGAKVEAMYTPDGKVDDAWYEVQDDLNIIRWVHGTAAPQKATFALTLTKELSTLELTAKWKKLAIILPFVSSLLVASLAFLSTYIPRASKRSTTSVWTIKGAVQRSNDFESYQVQTSLVPPDLRLKQDFTFEGQLPIEAHDDGSLVLPQLVFTINGKGGFDAPVVHLVNQGEKLPINADDYNIEIIRGFHPVIDIRKPIQFRRTSNEPKFDPTQIAVPAPGLQSQ